MTDTDRSADDLNGTGTNEADADVDNETPTSGRGRPCPLCDRPMYSRHCKYVCQEHGVVYDCSDTFY